jgi:GTP-binding protein EngB required for normal cell division
MNDQAVTQPSDQLRAQLAMLRDRLHDDVERVSTLTAVARRRTEIHHLLADLDRQLERIQRAAVITLVGATGAGKSTLLNALAGSSVAIEGVDRPTTRQPVIYAPYDAELSDLLAGADAPPGYESEGGPKIVRYSPSHSPWTAQILVDAPDLNSVDEQHRATVTALAERSDVLVVVLHRQSIVEAASVSFVDAFSRRRRLVFVLNRADELNPHARNELLAQVRDLAAKRWQAPDAPVICLSARDAQSQPRTEGWPELCRVLQDFARSSAIAGARRLNALGSAERIGAIFRAIRDETAGDLRGLADEVENGFQDLEQRSSSEVTERLRLRRADVATQLCAETARRWDGPGGWALRAGGLTSIGLGAGALLVRRNPLIAAGTASGAYAADRVQRALRDHRITDPNALIPARSEFASWYAEALSTARLRAGRLAGEPEAIGLAAPDQLYGQIAAAVDEAWNVLIDRDVPSAAERSALRFFCVVLDLPVYGLAAWILYRVATGFFAGEYAGVDFLVNAALLLLAYLYPLRMLIRLGLGARAGRLLKTITARTASALRDQAEDACAAVRKAAADYAAALDRLCSVEESWRAHLGTKGRLDGER